MTPPAGTRTYRGTARNLAWLAHRLQAGELVAVPTETVYGLAANAWDAHACRQIFRAKGRPFHDPLIVHIHQRSQLAELAHSNPAAERLAAAFWPGPLTLVLPKRPEVPAIVTAGLDSVAVRMPAHPLLRRLLKLTGLPLAAPSANPFGYVSPTSAAHVRAGLGGKIRHILDGGPAQIGLESTIVDVRDPAHVTVLRPGAITAAQVRRVLRAPVHTAKSAGAKARSAPLAPGMLARHYSPRAHLVLHDKLTLRQVQAARADTAWLFFKKPAGQAAPRHVYWLDAMGDQARAGRNLFDRLRALDARGYRTIHAEAAPRGSRADAINDRLRRAAAKR